MEKLIEIVGARLERIEHRISFGAVEYFKVETVLGEIKYCDTTKLEHSDTRVDVIVRLSAPTAKKEMN